ncbi:MAG: nuclease-related domain-containing protein [Anaerosomatales bacterium]|nr:nuclease-related domain-containing protein [Anaerosomatales bacterium]MDT8434779.1 nuclease-related domain-containing protein [Anaerosomatales bacterium]
MSYFVGIGIGLGVNRKGIAEFYTDLRGSKNWLKGAEGEALTDEALQALSDDYVVFHDFHPLGTDGQPVDWNVDHIVIGPSGVFILESKNYAATRIRPADSDPTTRKNLKQVQGTSVGFKRSLVAWSGGSLANLFVMPILVYTQPGVYVEKTRERFARVVPTRLLVKEIESSRD